MDRGGISRRKFGEFSLRGEAVRPAIAFDSSQTSALSPMDYFAVLRREFAFGMVAMADSVRDCRCLW